jgi:hypothetical protein
MAWSSNYLTILKSHTEEWFNAKGQPTKKEKLLKATATEIRTYREEHHPDEDPLPNLEKVWSA